MNCINCYDSKANEADRNEAIDAVLERKPDMALMMGYANDSMMRVDSLNSSIASEFSLNLCL